MKNHLPVLSKNIYQNPLKYIDGKRYTNPDPFVIRWCGRYYCYATDEKGVRVSQSDDLCLWEEKGFALKQEGYVNFWAPSVIYLNGIFYMYYSNEKEGTIKEHQEFLKLAVSRSPLGPFVYQKTMLEYFSIDSHPVQYGGDLYLLYSVNNILGTNPALAGTSIVMDKMLAMDSLSGHPRALLEPTLEEEIFQKNRFGDGRDWYTLEGACTVFYRDKCYLLYSANAYTNVYYFVGCSWAKREKDMEKMKWHKYPDEDTYAPLICKNGNVEGTGHNSVVKAPNLVDDWMVYHGRYISEPLVEGMEQREMRMDSLFYNGDGMITNGPTYLPQDVPGKPTEIIEEAEGCWMSKGRYDFYIAQLSTRPIEEEDYKGIRYRIYLNWIDKKNYIAAEVFSGENCMDILICEENVLWRMEHILLSSEYDHFVVHQFDIQREYGCYRIRLDGAEMIDFSYSMAEGSVGLRAVCCQVECYGFALSKYINLWGDSLKSVGKLLEISHPIGIGHCRKCTGVRRRQYTRELKENVAFTESYTIAGNRKGNRAVVRVKYADGNECLLCEAKDKQVSYDIYLRAANGRLMWMADGHVCDDVVHMEKACEIEVTLEDAELEGYSLLCQ